jgi:hypothetical protein
MYGMYKYARQTCLGDLLGIGCDYAILRYIGRCYDDNQINVFENQIQAIGDKFMK